MNIILHQPEIPANAGNIARTCGACECTLHLIKPLGFSVSDKHLKRAGLDYWSLLDIRYYDDFDDFLEKNPEAEIFCATTKAQQMYTEVEYSDSSYLMFGKETSGIPEDILLKYQEKCIRIPMVAGARSLNLSNSVAIVLYEALRQQGFKGLKSDGQLHNLKWK